MSYKLAIVTAGLMAFAGLFTIGCGPTRCDAANASIDAKYTLCNVDLPKSTGSTTGTKVSCTDEEAVQAECRASCYDKASCKALDISDANAAEALGTCINNCLTPVK